MHTNGRLTASSFLQRWRLPLLGLLVIVIAGTAYLIYSKKSSVDAQEHADKDSKTKLVFELAAIDVLKSEVRDLNTSLAISGSLVPLNQVTVRAKVGAEVRETLVQEGMAVTKGQVLTRFDAADLRARLTAQDASVDEAQAKLTMANKNRNSNESLLQQKYISQNAFDVTNNSVELAQASLKSALAQRQVAQLALADTEVKAPIDGIISKRHVQAGDKVSPDSPLFVIVNLSQLILEVPVPASEIPRVKIGQLLNFKVDGFGARSFSGQVTRINPAAESGSRSMLVYAAVNNTDAALKAGMFAKGSLLLEKSVAMPVIPLVALRQQNGKDVVYTLVSNVVQVQAVKLGVRNEDEGLVQVLSGLAPGAIVISAKLDAIKPGSKVSLPKVEAKSDASMPIMPTKPTATTLKG
ncbi:efflux RND transporter periplasmic adaptor subunit [Undibacterium sp.]|uniref:efflux RND transporter periplasmic adaptor subunit n=1 Tax=Undibacterium sp. TaxID=1914977 RepID=UPI0025F04403|nr:efflux RND transporter periplasmic adaptor subunit [Undibacterium sp.]